MAVYWIENKTPATGSVGMYNLITGMLAVGFTKVEDSDGTTRSATGVQVTSGASGSGGLGNTNAYVRMRYPDSGREVMLQRGTTDLVWRITYSALARFGGGSPDATHVPSATDTATVVGAGTDASPTFTSFLGTNNTYRQQGAVYDTAPYGFWFGCYPIGGGAATAGIVFDPMAGADSLDGDPAMWVTGVQSGGFAYTSLSQTGAATASRCAGWLGYGAGGSFVAIMANGLTSNGGGQFAPNNCPTNTHSMKHNLFPPVYGRPSGLAIPNGYKGVSTLLSWNPTSKTTGETYQVSTSNDRIVFGDVSFAWGGTATVI